MLTPARICDIVRQRVEESVEALHVFWCRVDDESRTRCADQVRQHRGGTAVVPLVVRAALFADPNAILSDLNYVLSESKADVLALDLRRRRPIAIVLLARVDFRLAQSGSAIRLPEWFPHLGGTEIYVRVRDLLFDVETSRFNAPEARADDLAAHMHSAEIALVRRMETTLSSDPRLLDPMWGAVATLQKLAQDRKGLQERLAAYRRHVDGVFDARAYRPTLKAKESLLSDLLSLVQRSSPDQMIGHAKALVTAIELPGGIDTRLPLVALLLRPTQPVDAQVRFAHSLLATLYGGYQFLNAVAHASDYPSVSAAFLYLNSRDLRLALRHAVERLEETQEE